MFKNKNRLEKTYKNYKLLKKQNLSLTTNSLLIVQNKNNMSALEQKSIYNFLVERGSYYSQLKFSLLSSYKILNSVIYKGNNIYYSLDSLDAAKDWFGYIEKNSISEPFLVCCNGYTFDYYYVKQFCIENNQHVFIQKQNLFLNLLQYRVKSIKLLLLLNIVQIQRLKMYIYNYIQILNVLKKVYNNSKKCLH